MYASKLAHPMGIQIYSYGSLILLCILGGFSLLLCFQGHLATSISTMEPVQNADRAVILVEHFVVVVVGQWGWEQGQMEAAMGIDCVGLAWGFFLQGREDVMSCSKKNLQTNKKKQQQQQQQQQ